MRIIHCADIHLDSSLNTYLPSDKIKERKAELLNTFHRLVEYASDNGVEAILIAGDLFDKSNIDSRTEKYVYDEIVGNPHILFFYLRGNHDAAGLVCKTVPDNLILFDDCWKTYHIGECVAVSGIEITANNRECMYDTLELESRQVNIVMLHGQDSEYISKQDGETISLKRLRNHCIDYLALGHIHSFRTGSLDKRGTFCYSGCLEGRGYDEAGEHGFVLLDVDEEQRTVSSHFIPFAKRRVFSEEADISGCTGINQIEERILDLLDELMISANDMVRLSLVGEVCKENRPDIYVLGKRLEGRCFDIRLVDNTELKLDIDKLMREKSLRGEFVREVYRSGLDEKKKKSIIEYGLRALKGEEITL